MLDSLYINYGIYGLKADSALQHCDIPKKALPPLATDSLPFNLLRECHHLQAGDYKVKILLRVNTTFGVENGEFLAKKIDYIESDWFYFSVLKNLRSSLITDN